MSCVIIESSLVVKNKVIISEKSINKTLCLPAKTIVNGNTSEIVNQSVTSGSTFTICIVNSLGTGVGQVQGIIIVNSDLEADLEVQI